MVKARSQDLRIRLIEAVNDGASKRSVAERFDVAPSTVVKLMQRWRQAGTSAPRRRGGNLRSSPIEAHGAEIDALVAKTVDITLVEIADHLATTHGRRFAPSVIWRYLDRHELTFKKNRPRQRTNSRRRCCVTRCMAHDATSV